MKTFFKLIILWGLLFYFSVFAHTQKPVLKENMDRNRRFSVYEKILFEIPLNPAELTFKEWKELPGISSILAGRIMKFQKYFGPITHFQELEKIYGLGEKERMRLKPYFAEEI